MEKWTEIWQDSRGISWEMEFEEIENEFGDLQLICGGYLINGGKRGVERCTMEVSAYPVHSAIPTDYGFLDKVEVRPRYQGAGLGTRLVEYAIEWLKSKGLKGCGGYLDQGGNMGARVRFFKRLRFVVSRNMSTIKLPFDQQSGTRAT